MFLLRIKHLTSDSEYFHYFNEEFNSETIKKLQNWLSTKATEAKESDGWNWDHSAYTFAAKMIRRFEPKGIGIKSTYDWTLEVRVIHTETL